MPLDVRRRDAGRARAWSSRAATGASPRRRRSCCACSRGRRRPRSATRACSASSRSRRVAWPHCSTPAGRSPPRWTSTRCSAGLARLATEAVDASYATVYEYRPHHDALVYRADTLAGTRRRPGCATTPWARCTRWTELPRGAGDPGGDPRRCRSTSRTPASPTTAAVPWRTGGRRRASACRCGRAGPRRASCASRRRTKSAGSRRTSCSCSRRSPSPAARPSTTRVSSALQEQESERLLELFDVSRRLASTLDRRAVVSGAGGGRREAARRRRGRAGVWLRDDDGLLAAASRLREHAAAGELAQQALAGGRTAEPSRRSGPAWPSRSPSRTGSRGRWCWRPKGAAASRRASARRCRCSPTWRLRRSRTSACTGAPSRRRSATVSRVSTTTATSRSGCGRSAAARTATARRSRC